MTSELDLVICVGTRPQFIKAAAMSWALRGSKLAWKLVHAGQHYDDSLSDIFFRDLDMPKPDYNLGVGSGSDAAQTAAIMQRLELVLLRERPRGLLVIGDSNTTLACALAAAKLNIPLAHYEAGLRSHDRDMPEEINRLATDAIADKLLTSMPSGTEALQREGAPDFRIHEVGNCLIDAQMRYLETARKLDMATELGIEAPYVLVTIHRRKNVGDPARLKTIASALERIGEKMQVVFPAHPLTRLRLAEIGMLSLGCGVRLMPPVGYIEFLSLMDKAARVITDSGGVQEETTALHVPCITVRGATERPETMTHGANSLVGVDEDLIVKETLNTPRMEFRQVPGWDGKAGERVRAFLEEWLA